MAEEIIGAYGEQLESITLVKGSKGRFEVTVDGREVFSKAAAHRHPAPGEVVEKMRYFASPYASQSDMGVSAQ